MLGLLQLPWVTPFVWVVEGKNPLTKLVVCASVHFGELSVQPEFADKERVQWPELGCLGPEGKRQQVTKRPWPFGPGDGFLGRAARAAEVVSFSDLPGSTFWNAIARGDLRPTAGFSGGRFSRPGPSRVAPGRTPASRRRSPTERFSAN